MTIPVARDGDLLARGVYKAPWIGPNGEWVFLIVSAERRLALNPIIVPLGASLHDAYDAAWEWLNAADPLTSSVEELVRRQRVRAV